MNPILTHSPDQYQTLLDRYAAIVEKTNQQLSLWSNPYGIAIGILTLVVALIAIGVSIVLYLNSKEQKDRFNAWLDKQEKEAKDARADAKQEVTKLITKQQEKMQATVDTKQKEIIEQKIDQLLRDKALIGATGPTGPFAGPFVFSGAGATGYVGTSWSLSSNKKGTICTHCGKDFLYDDSAVIRNLYSTEEAVHCPFCGTKNFPPKI